MNVRPECTREEERGQALEAIDEALDRGALAERRRSHLRVVNDAVDWQRLKPLYLDTLQAPTK